MRTTSFSLAHVHAQGKRPLAWVLFASLVWVWAICGGDPYGHQGNAFPHAGQVGFSAATHVSDHDSGRHDSRLRDACCLVLQQLSASVLYPVGLLTLHGLHHALSTPHSLTAIVLALLLAAGSVSAAGPPFQTDLPGRLAQLISSIQPNAPPY
ncbi:MAG: hypothetical protein KGJ12_07350 [Gammaproteobacteria bacterium]|nr:hypothetical protein [Gammaproteobacteria bacterium]